MKTKSDATNIHYIKNIGGPTLGYSEGSGVSILQVDGYSFKDLNKDGQLDKYEDWRVSPEERAKDLASKMSIEQIAGLMLYSRHQSIPSMSRGPYKYTYNGKEYPVSNANAWDLSDQQKAFLEKDHLRHILVTSVESTKAAVRWNNGVQAFAEGTDLGIPANNSSDPRHGTDASAEFNEGAGGDISMWPESLGIAATFDPEISRRFGSIASKEYRALGLTTALSPQVDLATDPRWYRFVGTFGEDPALSTDMGRAYIDGFQTSTGEKEVSEGWGYESVNAMVKHWPGGGSGEGGRDAHFGYGKYAVYPGDNFQTHLIPFLEGAFKLEGKTKKASAVMPYYTISYDQDPVNGEDVGNSYNSYIINDLLRKKYGYDGVVCTDWLITADEPDNVDQFAGKPWGVEKGYTVAERHYKLLMAGVDQFGGNNEVQPVIEAYYMGVAEHGEAYMRQRFEDSAIRLLKNIFRAGLFENPYLTIEESEKTVGNSQFMEEGYEAQLKSVVLLKNKNNILPLKKGKTVYIPKRYIAASEDWFGNPVPEKYDYPVNIDVVKKYFNITEKSEEADFGLAFITNPDNQFNPESGTGFSRADVEAGGNGYVPISLQYGTYTAKYAREKSIAGNRSYKEKTMTPANTTDLEMIIELKKEMHGKPVIVSLLMNKPAVVEEFEQDVQAIVANFGVQDQVIFDILTGESEPSGLLPMQLPANMRTVEEQNEDVPHDMECYKDSEGNVYDFAYGLNWQGVIEDKRTTKYKK
ncbi:glycoside hydrolase family 3 protein [Halalkalibacter okhensis]|nr:glycoside hydrolase family 3 N-terminal domain-containing protein [Halalkalibacter okhensis]